MLPGKGDHQAWIGIRREALQPRALILRDEAACGLARLKAAALEVVVALPRIVVGYREYLAGVELLHQNRMLAETRAWVRRQRLECTLSIYGQHAVILPEFAQEFPTPLKIQPVYVPVYPDLPVAER